MRVTRATQFSIHATGKFEEMRVLSPLARQVDGEIARTLGNAEIGRVNEWEGDRGNRLKQRMPFAGLALHHNTGLGYNVTVNDDVMRAGGAHAHGLPNRIDPHIRRIHWNAEMEHHRLLPRLFENRRRHQQGAEW